MILAFYVAQTPHAQNLINASLDVLITAQTHQNFSFFWLNNPVTVLLKCFSRNYFHNIIYSINVNALPFFPPRPVRPMR